MAANSRAKCSRGKKNGFVRILKTKYKHWNELNASFLFQPFLNFHCIMGSQRTIDVYCASLPCDGSFRLFAYSAYLAVQSFICDIRSLRAKAALRAHVSAAPLKPILLILFILSRSPLR
jgi:hypothetical protein